MSKYLGIDYGSKRIGIAVSDENKKIAFSREAIINDKNILENIFKIIMEENIERIIIGYPLSLKSGKTNQTFETEKFRDNIDIFFSKNKTDIRIEFFDERLSSRLAEGYISEIIRSKSKRRNKGLTDSFSAQIILQNYLDKINNK